MATSVVNPRVQFFANNGRPLIGGRIHTYVAGSSTRARTYKDAAKAQPNTNPIILDGRGEAQIYLAEGVEYKFVVEDSKGALIYTQEPVYGAIWPNVDSWPTNSMLAFKYAMQSEAARDEAYAAVESIGVVHFFDKYADYAGGISAGEIVEIANDETRNNFRTRYKIQIDGSLQYLVTLPSQSSIRHAILYYSDFATATAAATTLLNGQAVDAPDAAGRPARWTVLDGALAFARFTAERAVDIADAGAVPNVDCGSLLLSLIDAGSPIIVPSGDYVATIADFDGVAKFWANLSRITTFGKLVVTLPAGKVLIPAAASVTSNLSGLSIKGQLPTSLAVTGVAGVTPGFFTAYDGFGVQKTDWRYYEVTYAVADASSISVGDYVHIPWVSGDNSENTGALSHLGVHEVIAKAGNQITVLISSHYAPSTSIAAIEMQKMPTVLSFATEATFGVPAIVIANGGILGGNTPNELGGISDMVLVGKGCVINMPDGRGPGAFDAFGQGGHTGVVVRDNSRLMCGRNLCFSGWPASSLASSRNSALNSIYPITSSMAGRNAYVCSGSSMEMQNIVIGGRNYGTIATGSMNDGFENQDNGHMYADYSFAIGNHRTGYSNTGNAYGNFQTGTAIGNRSGGLIADGSHCIFKPGISKYNTDFGLRAQNRGLINAAGAEVRGNTVVGVYSSDGSEIQFGSGKSWENGPVGSRLDYRAYTGGRIEAVNTAVAGYTAVSVPPMNVIGPNGSVVSSTTVPTSIYLSASSTIGITLDSTNTTLFGTSGVDFPNGRIKVGGNVVAGGSIIHSVDNSYPFGLPAYRATVVYASSGAINTSDAREKSVPLTIDDAVLDAWGDVQLICYKWLSAIQQKGEDFARWHFGVIAQQVRDAFTARGLDGTRYGLLCYDEWQDEYQSVISTQINKYGESEEYDTGEKRLILAAGNRWGIRADQCLFLEAAYQRREMQRLKARVSALEMN